MPRAQRHVRAAVDWWRANRSAAPFMLEDELQHVVWLLSQKPDIGAVFGRRARFVVRFLYMPKTGYHVYYRVNRKHRRVEILVLWHAARGKPPPL